LNGVFLFLPAVAFAQVWAPAAGRIEAEIVGPVATTLFAIGVVYTGFKIWFNRHDGFADLFPTLIGGGLMMAPYVYLTYF
jgi:type IV secretory pathway VirB2 component (pilin)